MRTGARAVLVVAALIVVGAGCAPTPSPPVPVPGLLEFTVVGGSPAAGGGGAVFTLVAASVDDPFAIVSHRTYSMVTSPGFAGPQGTWTVTVELRKPATLGSSVSRVEITEPDGTMLLDTVHVPSSQSIGPCLGTYAGYTFEAQDSDIGQPPATTVSATICDPGVILTSL